MFGQGECVWAERVRFGECLHWVGAFGQAEGAFWPGRVPLRECVWAGGGAFGQGEGAFGQARVRFDTLQLLFLPVTWRPVCLLAQATPVALHPARSLHILVKGVMEEVQPAAFCPKSRVIPCEPARYGFIIPPQISFPVTDL